MFKKILLAMLAFGLIGQILSCDEHGTSGIVEDNEMWIGPFDKAANDMTKERFDSILDRVEAIYGPVIGQKGKKLVINRNWESGTVNAYAQQSGGKWMVSMFGGLARHEAITDDAFALVACHEIGHHIGGAPKKRSWYGSTWATNEGQADYFGSSKCLRKYVENDNNIEIVKTLNVPAIVTEKCEANFNSAEEVAACQRGAMAGLSLGNLFRDLRKLPTELKFTTPDTRVVTKTDHNHPAPQCRVDTYFQGAICIKHHTDDVSDRDATIGTCTRANSFEDGLRPLCWYKPAN